MGIHLAAPVLGLDVDELLVEEADDLDVVGGLHELHTLEGACGDEAGAVIGRGAPRDHLAFVVSDDGVGRRGSPKAEIWARRAVMMSA